MSPVDIYSKEMESGSLEINISSVWRWVKNRFEPAAALTDSGAQHMDRSEVQLVGDARKGNPGGCGQLGTPMINTRAFHRGDF